MDAENQAAFNGWAKVEVMGHQSHIGYVRTEAYGAAVLFRIDTPELPEREYVLTEPAYVDAAPGVRSWTRAGAKVKRCAVPGVSVLVGAGSIYRICPCTEAAALLAIEAGVRSELKLIEPPPDRALAAGESETLLHNLNTEPFLEDERDDTDNEDRCPQCGRFEDCVCP